MAYLLLLFFLSSPSFFPDNPPTIGNKWVATGNSKLEIQGSTNVNTFKCLSTNYHGGDTLVESIHQSTGYKILEGQINLRAADFDCEHALITRD